MAGNEEEFDQSKDVEEMFNSFREDSAGEERSEEEQTEKTAEEQEEKEATGEGSQKEGTQGSEEEKGEATGEEEERKAGEEKGEEVSEENEVPEADALRKTIDRLTAEQEKGEEAEETGEEEEKGEPEGETTQTGEETKSPFEVSDEEFNEMMKDKSKFVGFLNKFGDAIRQQAREDALRDVPDVVSKTTQRQQTLLEKKNQFFNDNPELKEHANYVGYTATRLYSQNPELSVDELFNKTAEQVRKDLALNKQAVEAEDSRMKKTAEQRKKPAFASAKTGGTRSQGGDNRNEMQKDLDAMIESLG